MSTFPNGASLSGHNLISSNVTRFVYLDESGTGKGDTHLVVAGIVVHADKQLNELESRIAEIADRLIPGDIRPGFVFHAVDLFNANKPFTKGKWTFDDAMEVGSAFAKAISETGVGIVWRSILRSTPVPSHAKFSTLAIQHSIAFVSTLMLVEGFMRSNAAGEVCIAVAENIKEHKEAIKQAQRVYRDQSLIFEMGIDHSLLPLRTIKDTVHFVEKAESPAIQMADFVCYLIRKAHMLDKRFVDLVRTISPSVIAKSSS